MFGLHQSRYIVDESGIVHDGLVEYCIDFICGIEHSHDFFPFAVNRVFREYLYGLNRTDELVQYLPVPIKYNRHIGIYFSEEQNYMEDRWLNCAKRLHLRIHDTVTSQYNLFVPRRRDKKGKSTPAARSGPVELLGQDQENLTFTFAGLLLCRSLAIAMYTDHRQLENNHEDVKDGKDKA